MAKMYGLSGVLSGKLGNTVLAVTNGVQVARQYQPVVSNPNSPGQIEQRAKLKLMSQLGAIMGRVIAIPREGRVSSRNLFTKINIGSTIFADGQADITLTDIKLTKSVVSLPSISAVRSENSVTLSLTRGDRDIDRVVYVLFVREGTEIRYASSVVVNTAGESNLFETSATVLPAEYVVYAYGIRANTDAARVAFSNLSIPTGTEVAEIISSRRLTSQDISITETRATLLSAPV